MISSDSAQRAQAAIDDARRADFQSSLSLLADWAGATDAVTLGWRASVGSLAWFGGAWHEPPPGIDDLETLVGKPQPVRDAWLGTASIVARQQILDLDGRSLARAVRVYTRLAEGSSHERARFDLALVKQWTNLTPEALSAGTDIKDLEREAARAGFAAETIEAAVIRALAEERSGHLKVALDTARRAVRMARTESLPQPEHLAALTLARMRRRNNQAHLAARIAAALSEYLPPPWRGWLDWESVLANGLGVLQLDHDRQPKSAKALLLLDWLSAASTGRRAQMDETDRALRGQLDDWAPARLDFEHVRCAIDPDIDVTGSPDLDRWRKGERHQPPSGLVGIAAGSGHAEPIMAYVIARPSDRGVRVLNPGAGLADEIWRSARSASGKQARPQALIAVLALAGPEGLSEEDAFAGAYGFAFNPELHRDAFNVTVHRARADLDHAAQIDRSDGRMWLSSSKRIAFPDPRCAWPLSDHVLRCLAQAGTTGASEIAGALGISLRSTQAALAELLEDGGCVRHKAGRNIEYALEDTTFQQPTRHR